MRVTTLGELCLTSALGPFGSNLTASDYTFSGVPLLRGQNVTEDGHLDLTDTVFVPEAKAHEFPTALVSPGDIITPHRGAIGRMAIIPPDTKAIVSSSMIRATLDTNKADPSYVVYYFSSPEGRAEVLMYASTVGTPGIGTPLTSFRQFRLPVPPLPEQKAIAEVLGALDDKIAANRMLADTADALVRALYDNLPDEGDHALADVCTNVRSQITPHQGGLAYVGLEHVPRRHMWLHDWGDSATVTSAKTEFKTDDILFGKLRPYFHKVVSAPMSGISSTDILVLRPKSPGLAGLVLAAASSDSVIADTSAASEGTRMPRTKWSLLSNCSIRWPGLDAAMAFSRMVIEIRNAVEALTRESRTLAELRDTLLPALMDGTIRVKDAETHVEEVL